MFEKFGKTIDRFIQNVSTETTATPIEVRSDAISAPYPTGDSAELRLELNVGRLNLSAGGAQLVDGTVTYNVEQWTPHVVTEGNRVTVKQDIGLHLLGAWHDMKNDWKLALGTGKPFALNIGKGAGESDITLGGVPLTKLELEIGAGKARMNFDKPNPSQASNVRVNVGAGSLTLLGLLNANAEQFMFSGGAGELQVGFTGESLRRSAKAVVNTGAGKITLNVQRGIACQITVKKFLSTVRLNGDFSTTDEEVYQTSAFSSAKLSSAPTLIVEINTPVGEIVLNEVN
ncbi:MAG TPA: toast rack family protein [Aggregatilineales bacterium]|nr:toast rack family protein [Aggregatilineales bacterium]